MIRANSQHKLILSKTKKMPVNAFGDHLSHVENIQLPYQEIPIDLNIYKNNKNIPSWTKHHNTRRTREAILIAEDYDEQTTEGCIWKKLRQEGYRGWQSRHPDANIPHYDSYKHLVTVRHKKHFYEFIKSCNKKSHLFHTVASYSDFDQFIAQTWSCIGMAVNIPNLGEKMHINRLTCHMPYYQDSNKNRLGDPERVIKLLKTCNNTDEIFHLIAQEPKNLNEKNKYLLEKLGKVVHHYSVYLGLKEQGYNVVKCLLKDDQAIHGENTQRYWSELMPDVTFDFVHAYKGIDGATLYREVYDKIAVSSRRYD